MRFRIHQAGSTDQRFWCVRHSRRAVPASRPSHPGIAAETERGEGNFNSSRAAPLPLFPAAYHEGEAPSLALGCERASSLRRPPRRRSCARQTASHPNIHRRDAPSRSSGDLGCTASPTEASMCLWRRTSATPLTSSFESLGLGRFGDSGTLAACALVTLALKELELKIIDIAVDAAAPDMPIAARADLGTTVTTCRRPAVRGLGRHHPYRSRGAGEARLVAFGRIARLSATEAAHVQTVPVPGKHAGELTEFQNPHLCNARSSTCRKRQHVKTCCGRCRTRL